MRQFFMLLIAAIFLAQCTQPTVEKPAAATFSDQDKSAILDAIQQESDAFYARNFETWKNKYTDPQVSWTCVEENGLVLEAYNKPDLDKLVGDYMKANPTPDTVTIRRENALFMPDANNVWVNFDEYQTVHGKTKILKGVRLMSKVDGDWKIAAMNSTFVKYE
ncbi:MAG: hypothetical protein H6577_01780 [Lewinellaceae bacterium]|nr:hypothetical protein [Saprospiraceae bacterium]MCB9336837.1 hypothetical protein [Lewinellaceae bacterium]